MSDFKKVFDSMRHSVKEKHDNSNSPYYKLKGLTNTKCDNTKLISNSQTKSIQFMSHSSSTHTRNNYNTFNNTGPKNKEQDEST